jgi:hypothetical protein
LCDAPDSKPVGRGTDSSSDNYRPTRALTARQRYARASTDDPSPFTAEQGRYLAFICYYTKIHGSHRRKQTFGYALALGATLVTANLEHMIRVSGLFVEGESR